MCASLQGVARVRIGLQTIEQARAPLLLFAIADWRRRSNRLRRARKAVNAVATLASNSGFRVIRAQKVRVRTRMAVEAGRIKLLRRHFAQLQNFGWVSAGRYMCRPWSVAALTRHALAAMHQRQLGMWVRLELLRDIRVARSTSFCPDKL